jgi:hypothetical protein
MSTSTHDAASSSASAIAHAPPTAITTDLDASLTSPTSPTSPHGAADAQRAMNSTDTWKPSFNRRQSWSKEEHKHELQMGQIGDVKTGPGFTERSL